MTVIPCQDASREAGAVIEIEPDHEPTGMLQIVTSYEGVSYMTPHQAAFFALKLLEWVDAQNKTKG